MNRQIGVGLLRNGEKFQTVRLSPEDIPAILALQANVKNALAENGFLSTLSEEEFTHILAGNGTMIGIILQGELIAFRAMLIPEIDAEHLGIDAGLPEEKLPEVIYSEISNVHPAYRGNGLQQYMGRLLMLDIDRQKFHYACATVAPLNIPSIKDKFSLGFHITGLKEKYGGMMRYIFIKDLHAPMTKSMPPETTDIPADDMAAQQTLLRSGYAGIEMKKSADTWYIRYEK